MWEDNLDLLLWLASIGGAFAPEGQVGDGYVELLAEIIGRFVLDDQKSWHGVVTILEQFIWSEAAFVVPVRALWEKVDRGVWQ